MPDKVAIQSPITLGSLIGKNNIEEFESFDLTEVQKVLKTLGSEEPFDIAQTEYLIQRSLYGAEILVGMMSKLIKTVSYLEGKINTVKNRAALEYKAPEGIKITADMRKQAGECSVEVEELNVKLAQAKGARLAVDRKYELLLKTHHFLKELSGTQKGSIISGTAKANGSNKNEMNYGATEWK